LFGVPLLSVNDHGIVTVPAFTRPQKASFAPAVRQFAEVDDARMRRFASPHVPAVFLQVGSQL